MSRPATLPRTGPVCLALGILTKSEPSIEKTLRQHLDALEAENRRLVEENHEYRRQIVSMRGA